MPALSVIIPVYNEEKNIDPLYQRLLAVVTSLSMPYEFIFVNDGSADATLDRVKDLIAENGSVKYIDLSRNFGHQVAVTAGLNFCKGKRIVIIDADLQDPPELIADMNAKMNDGFNVVYAKRKTREGETFFKLYTAKVFYKLLSRLTAIHIPV
ncbi:MAG TPA: glycosyltransferase family 2 protein, partial [Cyclobacteriaceae bacterium]|nr:glycosyltransferase family 2 protein [Cyclobacteriaceae bacterium]